MGGCRDYGVRFLLTIGTLISIGAACAGFIALIVWFVKLHMQKISQTLLIIVIAGACVSFLIFIYGLYAAWQDNKCHQFTLITLFAIFGIALLGIGIIILAMKKQVINSFEKVWTNAAEGELREDLEGVLNCSGWNENVSPPINGTGCQKELNDLYGKWGTTGGACLLALGVVLWVLVVLGCKFACAHDYTKLDDDSGATSGPSSQRGKARTTTTPKTGTAYAW